MTTRTVRPAFIPIIRLVVSLICVSAAVAARAERFAGTDPVSVPPAPVPIRLTLPGEEPAPPRFSIPEPETVSRMRVLKEKIADIRRLQRQIADTRRAAGSEKRDNAFKIRELQRILAAREKHLAQSRHSLKRLKADIASLSLRAAALTQRLAGIDALFHERIRSATAFRRDTLSFSPASSPATSDSADTPADRFAQIIRIHDSIMQDGNLIEVGKIEIDDGKTSGTKRLADALRIGDVVLMVLSGDGESIIFGHPGQKEIFRSKTGARALRRAIDILQHNGTPEIVDLAIPPDAFRLSPPIDALKPAPSVSPATPPPPTSSRPAPAAVSVMHDSDSNQDSTAQVKTVVSAKTSQPGVLRRGFDQSEENSRKPTSDPSPAMETDSNPAGSPADQPADLESMIRDADARIARLRVDLERIGKRLAAARHDRRNAVEKFERAIRDTNTAIQDTDTTLAGARDVKRDRDARYAADLKTIREWHAAVFAASRAMKKATAGSIWALSDPASFARIASLETNLAIQNHALALSSTAVPPPEFEDGIRELFGLQMILERAGRTVQPFSATVAMPDGVLRTVSCLRIGRIGAYGVMPDGEGAFIIKDIESNRWTVANGFLTRREKRAVAQWVTTPASGGLLPMDVTGSAAIRIAGARRSFMQWFYDGGPLMYLIALVGIIAAYLSVIKILFIARTSRRIASARSAVFSRLDAGDIDGATVAAAARGDPFSRVMLKGLRAGDLSRQSLESTLQEALLAETPGFTKHIRSLALLAGIAPLFGLLGTVTGMINTFRVLTLTGSADPGSLSGGISEALITTQAGLAVAVPIILAHGGIQRYVRALIDTIHLGALSLANRLIAEPADGVLNTPADPSGDDSNRDAGPEREGAG